MKHVGEIWSVRDEIVKKQENYELVSDKAREENSDRLEMKPWGNKNYEIVSDEIREEKLDRRVIESWRKKYLFKLVTDEAGAKKEKKLKEDNIVLYNLIQMNQICRQKFYPERESLNLYKFDYSRVFSNLLLCSVYILDICITYI